MVNFKRIQEIPAKTFVFVMKGKRKALGYAINYLNENFNKIQKNLSNIESIFYKVNDDRNSWIDYTKTVKTYNGSLYDRVTQGLINFKLSPTLEEIPELIYTDVSGFSYDIDHHDGTNIGYYENVRICRDPNTFIIEQVNKDLIVDFGVNVEDSLILLNGLFEPFEYISDSQVIFKKYKDVISLEDFMKPEIEVFTWNNIIISDNIQTPIDKVNSWFKFNNPVSENSFLFYNKVLYFFEVNQNDNTKIRIKFINDSDQENFTFENVKLIPYGTKDGRELKTIIERGINNANTNIVRFPRNTFNSIVLYEGIYHNYETLDNNMINFFFTDTLSESGRGVVKAITFFTKGDPSEQELDLLSLSNLIKEYESLKQIYLEKLKKISLPQEMINDYQEILPVNELTPNEFFLSKEPNESTFRFYINGILYPSMYYNLKSKDKKVTWLMDKSNGGFNIETSFIVKAIYDTYDI